MLHIEVNKVWESLFKWQTIDKGRKDIFEMIVK